MGGGGNIDQPPMIVGVGLRVYNGQKAQGNGPGCLPRGSQHPSLRYAGFATDVEPRIRQSEAGEMTSKRKEK